MYYIIYLIKTINFICYEQLSFKEIPDRPFTPFHLKRPFYNEKMDGLIEDYYEPYKSSNRFTWIIYN